MSYTEMKNTLKEATKKEVNQGGKEFLKALGGGLLTCLGIFLFSSHAVEFGHHVGRAEVLDDLSDAAEELESSNEDNKN